MATLSTDPRQRAHVPPARRYAIQRLGADQSSATDQAETVTLQLDPV
jgi:hypothetical protein